MLVPLRLLGVVACGAAMIGLNGALQVAAAADKLLLDNPIGQHAPLAHVPWRALPVAPPLSWRGLLRALGILLPARTRTIHPSIHDPRRLPSEMAHSVGS